MKLQRKTFSGLQVVVKKYDTVLFPSGVTGVLFTNSQLTPRQSPLPLEPLCGSCGLYQHCRSPKIPVTGKGLKRILVVGEAPGENEDRDGKPFVGRAGNLLRQSLAKCDVDLFADCWVTNALACRPTDERGDNRTPTDKEVEYCRPAVVGAIRDLEPEVVIVLGGSAVTSLWGWLWSGGSPGGMTRWAGWQIPHQRINAWLCPTWHPSYVQRCERDPNGDLVRRMFEKHLRDACGLRGRPWNKSPDYAARVSVEVSPTRAAERLRALLGARRGPVAWDLETTTLKPDGPYARILTCAVSDGFETLSFPWHGAVKGVMRDFLRGPIPKVGQNFKFETRWVLKEFGFVVRNWVWDTMLAMHVLDNRSYICGLDFQAFVFLGQEPWDQHVAAYMTGGDSCNAPNRLAQVDLSELLRYGGMDALIEWEVAQVQMGRFGLKP